jgi:hypothetical protein
MVLGSMVVWLTMLGCRGVDPAPEDVDGLLKYFWQNVDGEAAALAAGMDTLHTTQGAALEDVLDGTTSRLTREEVALVDSVDADPSEAAGIFMLNTFACPPNVLEQILVHQEQDALREGTYNAYARTFTSDRGAYESGAVETLTWDISLEASIIGADYSSELSGSIRRVETEVGDGSGTAFVQRTWFREPAVFQNNSTWEQDYQLEIYYERAPNEIVHLYGMWRQLEVFGFTSENEGVQRQVLGGMKDWDDETEALCFGDVF